MNRDAPFYYWRFSTPKSLFQCRRMSGNDLLREICMLSVMGLLIFTRDDTR